MDLAETRELSYFVAVAEELHFGRAAERLGMTQPPLSRAIQRLERRIGTPLLERTSRSVVLTPAGLTLLDGARTALDSVTAAIQRTRRAGEPQPRLTVAMKPGGDAGLLPDILDAYHADPLAVPAEVICSFGERGTLLRQGLADIAVMHSPRNDLTGFDCEPLLVEDQVVILPGDHRLAGQAEVRLEDLAGETMPRWPGSVHDEATGPEVTDLGNLMQLITLRQLVAVLPESAIGHLSRRLVAVPVIDAPPTTLVLAWPEQSTLPAAAAFVRVAADVAAARSAAPVAAARPAPTHPVRPSGLPSAVLDRL